jgi:hypothetical protein
MEPICVFEDQSTEGMDSTPLFYVVSTFAKRGKKFDRKFYKVDLPQLKDFVSGLEDDGEFIAFVAKE